MKDATLTLLTDLPSSELHARRTIQAWFDLGDGATSAGTAGSVADAARLLCDAMMGDTPPDYDPDTLAELPDLDEPIIVRAFVYELSEAVTVYRTHEAAELAYLRAVADEHPGWRLVVAWEAHAPRQDVAAALFEDVRSPS